MKKTEYWKLSVYRGKMDRHLQMLEDILFGRKESFRKEVTNEEGRLDNKKIIAFVTDILKCYEEYHKTRNTEQINPDQKELYKAFLYCAITGFSASSGRADGYGMYMDYNIPELYSDLVRMADYVQQYPMKSRKELKFWVSGDPSDEYFDPLNISTDDFWGLMEDAYSRLDPETIRKAQEKAKEIEIRIQERNEEAQKNLERFIAWQDEMKKAAEDEKTQKEDLPKDTGEGSLEIEGSETEDLYEDYDPYDISCTEENPMDEYFREILQPKYEAWEKQLPKKNYFCKSYECFKELYFTSKQIDKKEFAEDVRNMIDAYLFEKGLSPISLEDSSALVEDKMKRVEAMMLGTVRRARVLG